MSTASSVQQLCLAFCAGVLIAAPAALAEEPLPVAGHVTATAPPAGESSLWVERPVGAYKQPGWVKSRRFATTRVHIQQDPWEVEVEQWARGRLRDGEWSWRFQEEIEIGLPGRVQLDFYYDWTYDDDNGADFLDYAAEVRWGLADWGEIWGNPALYFEYKWTDSDRGGDVIEPKLLFGGEAGDHWQWGVNLVYERELSGEEEAEEYQVTGGLSRTVNDYWSVGIEAKVVRETVAAARSDPDYRFLIGPSVQFRPSERSHIDLVALVGCTDASPDIEAWFVGGFRFGGGGGRSAHAPVSGRR